MELMYIILDLDNTISDDGWRIPMIRWELEDPTARYDTYHRLCYADRAGNTDLFTNQKYGIVILTARPENVATLTEEWLRWQGVRWEAMLMRNTNEHGHAIDVKRNQLMSLPSFGFKLEDIAMAYDDRPDIVAMYRRSGIPAQVRAIHNICAYTPPAKERV